MVLVKVRRKDYARAVAVQETIEKLDKEMSALPVERCKKAVMDELAKAEAELKRALIK